jgi:hypothetical protein
MKCPFPGDLPFGAIISITSRCRFIFFNDQLRPLGLSAGTYQLMSSVMVKETVI